MYTFQSIPSLVLCLLVASFLAVGSTVAGIALESFESFDLGVIDGTLSSEIGSWASDGEAEVSSRRASSGSQALRIFGGDSHEVTLRLAAARESAIIKVNAERWTRRAPFEFTIEARSKGTWVPAYLDDGEEITIGGYNAQLVIQVDVPFDALRLRCTSPDGGGVLIDDLTIEAVQSMTVLHVTTEQPVLPVLIGNSVNPVARVRIRAEGTGDPIFVTGVQWEVSTAMGGADIAQARTFVGSESLDFRFPNACFADDDMFGAAEVPKPMINAIGSHCLRDGDNFLWLSVNLNELADIDGWVDAECLAVTLSNGQTIEPEVSNPKGVQRIGVAVRNAGDDDVAAFRIPGIVTTRHGTLIAVYDIRHRGWGDLPGDIDVGMRRSTDGGRTWEPGRTIMDMGSDPAWRHDGIGDPSVLYDAQRDTIWVAATWSHGNRSWVGSGPGMTPEETGQLMLVKSDDDGRSWSPPINITRQIKDPAWSFVLPSPGRGIAMSDGTLVFPAQFQLHPDDDRMPFATIIYSRDHGATWTIGRGARPNTTESCVIELEPGTLMLNMRDNRGGSRAISVSRDMGDSWEPHPTSRSALQEPVCNAGLIRVRATDDPRQPWLAFVNPDVARSPRRDMTIKLSTDGGITWPRSQQILLDDGVSAGYASLTMIDDETIGILYEGSRAHMTFQRVKVDTLMSRGAKKDDDQN